MQDELFSCYLMLVAVLLKQLAVFVKALVLLGKMLTVPIPSLPLPSKLTAVLPRPGLFDTLLPGRHTITMVNLLADLWVLELEILLATLSGSLWDCLWWAMHSGDH